MENYSDFDMPNIPFSVSIDNKSLLKMGLTIVISLTVVLIFASMLKKKA